MKKGSTDTFFFGGEPSGPPNSLDDDDVTRSVATRRATQRARPRRSSLREASWSSALRLAAEPKALVPSVGRRLAVNDRLLLAMVLVRELAAAEGNSGNGIVGLVVSVCMPRMLAALRGTRVLSEARDRAGDRSELTVLELYDDLDVGRDAGRDTAIDFGREEGRDAGRGVEGGMMMGVRGQREVM